MNAPADTPETEAPFLAAEPPPVAARGLAWLVIAVFCVVAFLAVFVRLPETVSTSFVLVPVRGTDPVRAPRGGTVAEVRVAEGHAVAKGTPLFAIRSSEFRDRASEKSTLETQVRGADGSLANARSRHESESRATAEELRGLRDRQAALERLTALKKEQLALTRDRAERARKLHEQGLASLNDLSDAQIRHSQTVIELEQQEDERRSTVSAIQKLLEEDAARQTEFHEWERSTLEKQEQMRIRIAALAGEPETGAAGELAVPAPCDGTVVRMKIRGAGAVVVEGDALCEVSCSGETLRAELNLPQLGLARVSPGQPVKLLFDAFPYQRYGVQGGSVLWASPASVPVGDASAFPVLVDLAAQSIVANGRRQPFLAGMHGTARIVVGRRSALAHAFEPLRQLREVLR
ncbi:HlyD family efflux transporter periplasmic adaptor subunit [bacterium]|nr:HlyD family efflux transporter periplasmic adaptor subunit [bacterium]